MNPTQTLPDTEHDIVPLESVNAVEGNDGCKNYTKFLSALCGYNSASSLSDLAVRILTARANIG